MKNLLIYILFFLTPAIAFTQASRDTILVDSSYLRPVAGKTNALLLHNQSFFHVSHAYNDKYNKYGYLTTFDLFVGAASTDLFSLKYINGFEGEIPILLFYEKKLIEEGKVVISGSVFTLLEMEDMKVWYGLHDIKLTLGDPSRNITLILDRYKGFPINTFYGIGSTGLGVYFNNRIKMKDPYIVSNSIGFCYDWKSTRISIHIANNQEFNFDYDNLALVNKWNTAMFNLSIAIQL